MTFRSRIESLLTGQVGELTASDEFQALETGRATRDDHDRFIVNVARTHLHSPQILAFLFTLAPPEAAQSLRHNMLEELGIEEESGIAHPTLLEDLLAGAGFDKERVREVAALSQSDLRQVIVDPLLFGTLKEVGLAALVEVVAFEFMLSRVASRMARALAHHRALSPAALEWFTHHSEVDIGHAEQGLDNLERYVRYYELSDQDAFTIFEMTLRENVFIKRYFGEMALARASGRAS